MKKHPSCSDCFKPFAMGCMFGPNWWCGSISRKVYFLIRRAGL